MQFLKTEIFSKANQKHNCAVSKIELSKCLLNQYYNLQKYSLLSSTKTKTQDNLKVNKLHGVLNSFHLEVMLNLISVSLLLQTCQVWNTGILSHMNGNLISFIHCLIYLDGLNDGPIT